MNRKRYTRLFGRLFPLWARIFCGAFVIGLLLRLVCRFSPPTADFCNRYISSVFRAVLGHLTALLPFSLAETAVICLPVFLVAYSILCVRRRGSLRFLLSQIFTLLGLLSYLFAVFLFAYAPGYHGAPLADKLSLDAAAPSADRIYEAACITADRLNELEPQIYRTADGASKRPYSFRVLSAKLNDAYEPLYETYRFLSPLHVRLKPIALSRALTYTQMSGFYTFWSGEANVNTNYPDYVTVFSAAHEMAHQRGVAPEDEANFVAYLACEASDDPYIRYCGYAGILDYLCDALYTADAEKYALLDSRLTGSGYGREWAAYCRVFDRYRNETVASVSDAVNNAYLHAQGQTEGSGSYGLVTDLAVAYILRDA